MNRSNIKTTTLCTLAAAAFLAGCADMSERQKGTATGAAIGAVAGAVLSSATGGKAGTGAVVGGALGAVGGNLWSKRMEEKRAAMEQATQGTGIDVARTPDNQLKVNVPSDFSFDIGRSAIKPQMRPVLDQFAQGLDPNMRVRIVGHTDSTGSDAINNPLSVDRAQSVRDYLAGRGVAPSRVETQGHGSREPVADNGSDAGRAQNRRVEIFLREPAPQG
ncbi:OmpA family protein [Rhizobacter sp. AJA081-3]|uniref:OmpA family protein n=1 Tax=Rhizobacter sp. AJA081-3 TaxID=2753607 RepID=UPI001ADFF269|nr:OmpA family protein [Rhizobacter sp. AJA081-3]QTN21301.1 OmpA family protein [Rhizobacter sp. AJA081-3]